MQLLLISSVMGVPTALPKACSRLEWGWKQASVVCNLVAPAGSPWTGVAVAAGAAATPQALVTPFQATIADPPSVPMAVGSLQTEAQICKAFGGPQGSTPVSGIGTSYPWKNRCRRALDAYAGLVRVCASGSSAAGAPDGAPQDFAQPPMTHAQRAAGLTAWAQLCTTPNFFALTPQQQMVNVCPGLAGWWSVTIQACGFPSTPVTWDLNQGIRNAGVGATPPVPQGVFGASQPLGILTAPVPQWYAPAPSTLNPAAFQWICSGTPAQDLNLPSGASPSTGRTFRNSRCRRAADQFGRAAKQCKTKGYMDWFVTVSDTLNFYISPTYCAPTATTG